MRWRGLSAVLLAGLLSAGAVGCGSGDQSTGHAGVSRPSANLGTVLNEPVPPAIANLPLTTADGKTVTLASYRGRPVMIADFLTLCTDICPMISANSRLVADRLTAAGAGNAAVLEVSVDPQRDTPARLAAYQRLYGHAPANWTLARTSPANTTRLWRFFRVWYHRAKEATPAAIDWYTHKPLTYDVDHTDAIIFLDGTGHLRFVASAAPNVQRHLPPTRLVNFLNDEGRKALRHPPQGDSWTVGQAMSVFSWLLQRHLTTSAS